MIKVVTINDVIWRPEKNRKYILPYYIQKASIKESYIQDYWVVRVTFSQFLLCGHF